MNPTTDAASFDDGRDEFLVLLEESQRIGISAPVLLTYLTIRALAVRHANGAVVVRQSQALIADHLRLDRKTVCGHIALLRSVGWIEEKSRRGRYPQLVLVHERRLH